MHSRFIYILYGPPNPKQLSMHKSMHSLNCENVLRSYVRGKVMLMSQVDDLGKINSSVNWIEGGLLNPAAGSLVDPDKKCRISAGVTSVLSTGSCQDKVHVN